MRGIILNKGMGSEPGTIEYSHNRKGINSMQLIQLSGAQLFICLMKKVKKMGLPYSPHDASSVALYLFYSLFFSFLLFNFTLLKFSLFSL